MIELSVLNYLNAKLSVPVYMEFPENPPECFAVLRKVDSGRENHVESAMFRVRSYAGSLLETARLNEQVKAALDSLPELDEIASTRLNGDYPYNDTANKRCCYQAVYDITHY